MQTVFFTDRFGRKVEEGDFVLHAKDKTLYKVKRIYGNGLKQKNVDLFCIYGFAPYGLTKRVRKDIVIGHHIGTRTISKTSRGLYYVDPALEIQTFYDTVLEKGLQFMFDILGITQLPEDERNKNLNSYRTWFMNVNDTFPNDLPDFFRLPRKVHRARSSDSIVQSTQLADGTTHIEVGPLLYGLEGCTVSEIKSRFHTREDTPTEIFVYRHNIPEEGPIKGYIEREKRLKELIDKHGLF